MTEFLPEVKKSLWELLADLQRFGVEITWRQLKRIDKAIETGDYKALDHELGRIHHKISNVLRYRQRW